MTRISIAEPVAQKKIPNDVFPGRKSRVSNAAAIKLVLPALITTLQSIKLPENFVGEKHLKLTETHPSNLPCLDHTRLTQHSNV